MTVGKNRDWFLKAWLEAHRLKQADLVRRTGWSGKKVSYLVNGRSRYNRDYVNGAAEALDIEPFELLLHPDDAMALRRLRSAARDIAADRNSAYKSDLVADEDGQAD